MLRPLHTALLLVSGVVAQSPPPSFQLTVQHGATSHRASFSLHTARGPAFNVVVQQADGSLATHQPGPVRTYIGTLPGLPGAMASAVRRADGSTPYHVLFADGAEWINNGTSTTLRTSNGWTPRYPTFVTGTGGAGGDVWAAEVGVDLPYSQFSVDNDVDAALEMVEHSINTVNLIYLRDASVLHRLGRVVVRAASQRDPYAGMTTTNALLGEIGRQWNSVLPSSSHDVALVATSATGGGLAAVGVVGSPGYSANGATVEGDFTVVWRHEVGHNWSLGHYDGGTPEGPTINSGNALSRMSGPEQALLLAHRSARAASLDRLGPHPTPIPPRASLDRMAYPPQSGPLRIDVLDNDHDANGEALTIAAVDGFSRLGGAVAVSPGTGPGGRDEVLYTPPAVPTAQSDWFSYSVVDTAGREGLGYVATALTGEDDLLAHYTLDQGTGAPAKDSSAYARHAAPSGAPVWAAGRIGGGIALDGVDDSLQAAALDQSIDRVTITAWVKRSGAQNGWAGIVFCRGGSTTAGINFGTANELRYHWGGGHWQWNSGLVVPDGRWTFVALRVTPTAATLMMDDGSGLRTATNAATHAVEAFDDELNIGRDPHSASRTFGGVLDEIRIWRRDLTVGEVRALAAGFGPTANPIPDHLSTRNTSAVVLTWRPAPTAVNHRVYFSSVYADVRDGAPAADQGLVANNWWTTPLLGNGSWFWRVDTTDGVRWLEGAVWSFAVVPGPTIALAQAYGSGCAGSSGTAPSARALGLPRPGTAGFALELAAAPPNTTAALLISTQPDRRRLGTAGCALLLRAPAMPIAAVSTDPAGRAVAPMPIPTNPALLGARLFTQFGVTDPGGALFGVASLTNALHLTIGL